MLLRPFQPNVFVALRKERDASRNKGNIAEPLKLALDSLFANLKAWVVFFELGFEFGSGSEMVVF